MNMNQNPQAFWDFISSMQNGNRAGPSGADFPFGRPADFDPFTAWGSPFGGQMPHRGGRSGPHPPRGEHPPPPPHGEHPPPPPEHDGEGFEDIADPPTPPPPAHDDDHDVRGPPPHHGGHRSHHGPPPPPPPPGPHHGPEGRHHGPPGGRGRGGHGGPSHPHHGPPPHGPPGHGPHGHHHGGPRGGHHGGPRGGRHGHGHGPRGGHDRSPFPFDLNEMASFFAPHLFGASNVNTSPRDVATDRAAGTFVPDVDVFDMQSRYIVHASLPGVKKSDIDVSWNASNSSVVISGIVHRPEEVDEDMLNTLATDERRVGAFERSIRLGSQDVKIDVEGIGAKLEDGVLRVVVPKVREDEWTEVRKVDIE